MLLLTENSISLHSLVGNSIGDKGVSELASVLKECQKLKELKYEMDHCVSNCNV